MKVLIVEDDCDMQKILMLYLKKEGYRVTVLSDGEEAIHYLLSHSVDLVILDWMMPKKSGIEVCKEIRTLQLPIKILMLTAKSTSDHEVLGLSCGADDYIRKPFDMKVLLLRIKKLCKQEEVLRCDELVLNQQTCEVFRLQEPLKLTKKEYELLRYLMLNYKITVTREQILNHVWGIDYEGDIRTVDTHIRRLRAKIGDEYIKTNVGMGYRLEKNHE